MAGSDKPETTADDMKAKAEAKKAANKENPEMEGFTAAEEERPKGGGAKTETSFYLKIYSPYKTYYEGEVESITAKNDTGVFDILQGHKNFMTLLLPYTVIIRSAAHEDQELKINRGIMHVKADKVIVFLDV